MVAIGNGGHGGETAYDHAKQLCGNNAVSHRQEVIIYVIIYVIMATKGHCHLAVLTLNYTFLQGVDEVLILKIGQIVKRLVVDDGLSLDLSVFSNNLASSSDLLFSLHLGPLARVDH